MRKKLLFLVIASVLSLLSFLGYNIITKVKEKNTITQKLQTIPEFEFLTLERQVFTKANLKQNVITILIYFNSECDFCQNEAQSISANIDKFKNVQFVFVSTEAIVAIQQFSEKYNLKSKQNIIFLYDNISTFSSRFDTSSIPFLLIYDKNQKLIKKHKGQLNAKGILRALQEYD